MNEHRNTIRALKDEELLVSSLWCRFGIHNWTRWKDAERGRRTPWYDAFAKEVKYRERYCCHCNKVSRTVVYLE
jgi:hypothetical protein